MVPPVRPVRFRVTGADVALDTKGDCCAAVVVVPDDSVDEVPHLKEMVLDAPFEVPVPLSVAVCSATFDAGSVVAVGGTIVAGVVNDRMDPVVVFAPFEYVPLTWK